MTFLGVTEHFSGKNGASRWSILVGKQKHNVQRPKPVPSARENGLSAYKPLLIGCVHILSRSLVETLVETSQAYQQLQRIRNNKETTYDSP